MVIPPDSRKKIITSAAVLIIGILACSSALDFLFTRTPIQRMDDAGTRYHGEIMRRALTTFAVVRGLNGIISVIQGTDISVSPAGVGVKLAIGEILDPVNDLMERFSWVMLLSAVSVGIQMFLMEIGAWMGLKILFACAMLLFAVGIWYPMITTAGRHMDLKTAAAKLALIALIIRFGIPCSAIVGETAFDRFLKTKYDESMKSLEQVNAKIKEADLLTTGNASPDDQDWMQKARAFFQAATDVATIKQKIEVLKDSISEYTQYTVNLIVVFLLETVLIPIGMIWGLMRLGRSVIRIQTTALPPVS